MPEIYDFTQKNIPPRVLQRGVNRRVLKEKEKVLKVEYSFTIISVDNLASILQDQGKCKAAEEMNRRTSSYNVSRI